ncbi:DNA alkylation repair protein [candidate division KSB1 bacterium]|nr:DNA alkylation repair protein [candidate division KSB1 bacterium]RQW01147.1 MAG: DNA alkylation repair protein [candidate division KSB1 bacterium]
MAEKLKNMFFTPGSIEKFAHAIKEQYADFDVALFKKLVFDDQWETLELKERMRHTTCCLQQTLPKDYAQAIDILKKGAPAVHGFEAMTLHDYVEMYGQDNWNVSLPAIRYFNQFASGEFAIRPFLDQNPQRGMEFMLSCAEDSSEKIRRFASEGCRPRLPWAMALPKFKKDPSLIFPVLEKLKDDDSDFVRNSVANNLNDISKDHPDMVLHLCETWHGISPQTDWIIKQACRSLLKAGDKRAMRLFGFGDPDNLSVENLAFTKTSLSIGQDQYFSFNLNVQEDTECKIRLEYAVFYVKANKVSKKIFQISENSYSPGIYSFKRKQTFEDMSTRKHYPGTHAIAIIVNGEEKARGEFKVTACSP